MESANTVNMLEHKKTVYFSIIISTLMMFMHHYTRNTAFAYIGLMFMLIPVLSANISECMCMIMFYIPNIRMYAFSNGGNTLVGFLIIAIFAKMFFSKSNMLSIKTIIAVAFMGVVVLINANISHNSLLFMSYVRFSVGMLLISIYLFMLGRNLDYNFEIENLMTYFIYGCISLLVCGILFNLMKGYSLFAGRFAGINNDPNFFAMIIGTALSIQLVNIAFNKKSTVKSFIIALFFLFGGMLSVSRSYVLSVSVNILLVMYIFFNSNSLNATKKLMVLVLIVIILFVFRDTVSTMVESFAERFHGEDVEGGNGRFDINRRYMELWKDKIITIFFGIGSHVKLLKSGIVREAQHNFYVQLLTSLGLCGVVAMLNIYRVLYKLVFVRKFKLKVLLLFPIITYGMMLMTLPALFDDTHLYMLLLMMMQYRKFQNVKRGDST